MAISAPRVNVEQRQIGNQPIGVVRVYEGQATANAIADGADRMAGMLFERAAEDAQSGATELAQSIAQGDVLAIDPKTGAPMALSNMDGMGRIASQAYRNVINSRFQQGIEEEIRNQAQVLAAQYEASSDPVGMYTNAMSSYVAAMANNATGSWRSFIEDAGTSYINRTRAALAVQQLRRTRAELAAAQKRANAEALNAIEAAVIQGGAAAIFGTSEPTPELVTRISSSGALTSGDVVEGSAEPAPDFIGPPVSIVDSIGQSATIANQDAVAADVLPASVMNTLPVEARMAVARGMVQNYARSLNPANPATETQLIRLKAAIGAQDMPSVARIAPELAPYLAFMASSPSLFREFERFSDGVLSDFATLAGVEGRETREAQETARQMAIAAFNDETGFAEHAIRRNSASLPQDQIGPFVGQVTTSLRNARSQALTIPDKDEREAQIARVEALSSGLREGLFERLTRGMSTSEIDRVQQAFGDRDLSRLSEEERFLFSYTEALESIRPGTFDEMDRSFDRYRSGPARGNQQRAEEAAYNQAQIVAGLIPEISMQTGQAIDAATSSIVESARSIAGLSDGDRRSIERDAFGQAMRGHLIDAFGSAMDQDALVLMRGYVAGTVSGDQIPEAARDAIDRARQYSGLTGRDGDLNSAANDIMTRKTAELSALERNIEQRRLQENVLIGLGNPDLVTHREAAQQVIENFYRGQTGQALPSDFFTNPDYLGDANLSEIMRLSEQTPGFMPAGLHDALSAIARGNLQPRQGFDPATVLTHWSNMRTIDVNGSTFRNSAVESLSERDIGILDLMSDSVAFFGVEGFAESYRAAQLAVNSPEFKGMVSAQLNDMTLTGWLYETVPAYSSMNGGQRASIQSLSSMLLAMSQVNPQIGSGERWLKNRLETHIDRMLPDSKGSVIEYDSNGLPSTRSQFALEKVLGQDSDAFKTYVLDNVSQYAPSAPTVFPREFSVRGAMTAIGLTRQEPHIFLVPSGKNADGGVAYYVHMLDPNAAQTRQVLREDAGNERTPLIVSTNEPAFTSSIVKTDYIGRAKNRRELLDRFGSDTGVYLGVD